MAIDGRQLAAYYRAGARWLSVNAPRLNALNVFPVPDGDTGTNMRLTLEAAVEAIDRRPSAEAGVVARLAAEAALLGARGNSGVILSQIMAGVAAGLQGCAALDAEALRRAASEAERFAYRAVANPVEGTMLTAVRAVAAALATAPTLDGDWNTALAAAVQAVHAAVEQSPSLLPRLRQAGVVDAGAEGLAVILDGMARHATGAPLDAPAPDVTMEPNLEAIQASAHTLDEHGYCTNFVVRLASEPGEGLREAILALGTSAVVASAGSLVKVHLHTERPGLALETGARYGELAAIEIANMRDQVAAASGSAAERSAQGADHQRELPSVAGAGVVAVVPSFAMAAVFAGLGAATVPGGATMNPSAGAILSAADAGAADHVFILPNNANVLLAAREAARHCRRPATVIPSVTLPQGVAAAIAYLGDRPAAENEQAMTEALSTVVTIEVTVAVRNAEVDGRAVRAGQALALADGRLVAVGEDVVATALAGARDAVRPEHTLLTVYFGEGVGVADVEALRAALQGEWPEVQIETVDGGQLHYPFILALE